MKLKVLKILTIIVAALSVLSGVGFYLLPAGIKFTPDPVNPLISYGRATSGLVCLFLLVLFSTLLLVLVAILSVNPEWKNKEPS